jgi:hypothetical protein
LLKVAIVGGGWYGCHIALSLKSRGCEVSIFEEKQLLSGAGLTNQLRLHLGYHYLRSQGTREQAKAGFVEFLDTYGDLSAAIRNNLYAVPLEGSTLDYGTVSQILAAENLPHHPASEEWRTWSNGFEAVFATHERYIDVDRSREYFSRLLKDSVVTKGVTVEEFDAMASDFDFVIDASYSSRFHSLEEELFEATLICEFEQSWGVENFEALTLVDGELWSIYPTEKPGVRSLSHVKFSPVFTSVSEAEVKDFIAAKAGMDFEEQVQAMKEHVVRHVPNLARSLETLKVRFLAKKIKSTSSSASRVQNVSRKVNIFHVRAGKIDAVFESERKIIFELEQLGAL